MGNKKSSYANSAKTKSYVFIDNMIAMYPDQYLNILKGWGRYPAAMLEIKWINKFLEYQKSTKESF